MNSLYGRLQYTPVLAESTASCSQTGLGRRQGCMHFPQPRHNLSLPVLQVDQPCELHAGEKLHLATTAVANMGKKLVTIPKWEFWKIALIHKASHLAVRSFDTFFASVCSCSRRGPARLS